MSSKGRKIIFIKDWGAYLSVKNGMFVCKVKKEVKWTISPVEVEAIVFLVNSLVSTEAIKLAQEYGVTIFFFNGNKPISLLLNAKYSGSMRIWLHQMRAYKKRDLEFAKEFAKGKLNNQLAHLRYYYKKYDIKGLLQYMGKIEGALNDVKLSKTVDDVRHYEAEGARNYWKGVVMLVPKELEFKKREKRGAKDPFNSALNIGYGILRAYVWKAVILAGLNPYIGFLHRFRSGRLSLVFDLMEEFRAPFVDKPLVSLAREKPDEIKGEEKRGVYEAVINAIKEEEIISQARALAKAIVNGTYYIPYRMR